jgi:hypothetical protein
MSVAEFVAVEQGMAAQNLGLMTQALGLGGFPNFARHEFCWFEALGFRMGQMPGTRYAGAGRLVSLLARLLGRDVSVPYPLGMERNGEVLLKAYCPPYYPTMTAAVQALVERKYGPGGAFRGAAKGSWRDPATPSKIAPPSDRAIAATAAYCEYLFGRYGRFPAYPAAFLTTIGYQAVHLDLDFYNRFYRPEALTETQRQHLHSWHSSEDGG